jgi:hypothetical protein
VRIAQKGTYKVKATLEVGTQTEPITAEAEFKIR